MNSTLEKKNLTVNSNVINSNTTNSNSSANNNFNDNTPNKNELNTPNKKMKPFNYNYGAKGNQATQKTNEKTTTTTTIKNTKADPQKIIKSNNN